MLFDGRPSDSPFVEIIWRSESEGDNPQPFMSVAACHWELVVTRLSGQVSVTLRGPKTHASRAICPPNGEFFGIVFKLGTAMPHLPISALVNGGMHLPTGIRNGFWLAGAAWELPTYDNADTFVQRLMHTGLLTHDAVVQGALIGRQPDLSRRSIQRHFLHTTGLSQASILQIERARYATGLLKQGLSILDTVTLAGYADQPHLTRALKRYSGHTPTQLMDDSRALPLSFVPDAVVPALDGR